MNALRLLLPSSAMALLAACTTSVAPFPDASPPEERPGPTYTTTTTATLTPAPGRAFGHIAAASAGDDAAIAYTESDEGDSQGVVRHRIALQRLDAMGTVSGPPVELDTVEWKGHDPPALTLATDGARYLACWQRTTSIACARVPAGEGLASPALSVIGAWPSLAYGSGTFALAYGAPEHVAIVRVASDGTAAGSPATFATGEDTYPRTFLAPTDSGFALVDGDDGWNSNVRVRWLDSDFAPIIPPIDLGLHLWRRAAIAAHGTNVAIGLSEPYGGRIFTLDGGTVTHNHAFSAGGKLGMNVALLANEASFDMLSTHDFDPGLRYRTLQEDEVIASEQALLTERDFEDSTLAPLRLHGDLFLAATDGWLGREIVVVRVQRP